MSVSEALKYPDANPLESLVAKALAPAPLPKAIGVSRPAKSPAAFRTISEAAEDLGVPQHVLRFWETKFSAIRPLKRGGNRRYYRPEDINLLKKIHHLLYVEGYTIKGAQKFLKGAGKESAIPVPSVRMSEAGPPVPDFSEDGCAREVGESGDAEGDFASDSGLKGGYSIDFECISDGSVSVSHPKLSATQREGLQAVLADLLELRGLLSGARA